MGIERYNQDDLEKLAAGVPAEEVERVKKESKKNSKEEDAEERMRKEKVLKAFEKSLGNHNVSREFGKRMAMRRGRTKDK